MAISKETKNIILFIEGVVGVFSILTGRWTLAVIDAIAGVVTASVPVSRNSKE